MNTDEMIEKIEEHGFLDESIHLLKVLQAGKAKNESYGRGMMKTLLLDNGCILTDQQLRLRIEVLRGLGLLNVRKGRAGTTITSKGDEFLTIYERTGVDL
jgi:repressor of nif and glnA expression